MWKLNLMYIHISDLWLGTYMVSVTGAHKWWILAPACICPIDGCWLPVKWIKHFDLAVVDIKLPFLFVKFRSFRPIKSLHL